MKCINNIMGYIECIFISKCRRKSVSKIFEDYKESKQIMNSEKRRDKRKELFKIYSVKNIGMLL